jgi:hypothetical protein
MFRKRRFLLTVLLLVFLSVQLPHNVAADSASVSPGRFSLKLGASDQVVERQYNYSMILAGTVGDLLFEINLSAPRAGIQVYVPPEFGGLLPGNTTNIWTSITNDYRNIQLQRLRYNDTVAPFWYRIVLGNQTSFSNAPSQIKTGTHFLRMFNVQAPLICGRYFFKVFVQTSSLTPPTSIGSGNFPTVVVSASLNPAFIAGRLLACQRGYYYRYGFGEPIAVPGKVVVDGTTYLGTRVTGIAYVNASLQSNYTVYGLEAGTYNITASADGYPSVTLDRLVNVREGQSLEGIDIYLCRGANISGIVWSKCELAPVQWGNITFIDPFSPKGFRAVNGGFAVDSLLINNQSSFPVTLVIGVNATQVQPGDLLSAFPFSNAVLDTVLTSADIIPNPTNSTIFQRNAPVVRGDNTAPALRSISVPKPFKVVLYTADGPPVVNITGTTNPKAMNFNFSAWFSQYDGHIPQDMAGYVSGIGYGDYTIRPFVNQYVQLEECRVGVFNQTYSMSLIIDLHRTGKIVTTIHLKDVEGGAPTPSMSDHVLVTDVYDQSGALAGTNFTLVPQGSTQTQVVVTGFSFQQYFVSQTIDPLLSLAMRDFLRGGVDPPDYGLLPGTYSIKTFLGGYVQGAVAQVTVDGCSSTTETSFEMYKGGQIILTLRSVNWQQPCVPIPWTNPAKNITVFVYDASGQDYGYFLLGQRHNASTVSRVYTGLDYYNLTSTLLPYILGARDRPLDPRLYLLKAYTTEYLPSETAEVVIPGGGPGVGIGTADLQIDLKAGGTIIIDISFKTETLFSPLAEFPFRHDSNGSIPIRIEVFDDQGELVGASVGYAPKGTVELSYPSAPFLRVKGLDRYYGTYTISWVNYFHTTDSVVLPDRGLSSQSLSIKVFVPGYDQISIPVVTLTPQGQITVSIALEKMAHLKGMVYYRNMFNLVVPLSWAAVSLIDQHLIADPTLDGRYEMWAPQGSYPVTAGHIAYQPLTQPTHLSAAAEAELNFYMVSYAGAVPEIAQVQIFLTLTLSLTFCLLLTLIRRRYGRVYEEK